MTEAEAEVLRMIAAMRAAGYNDQQIQQWSMQQAPALNMNLAGGYQLIEPTLQSAAQAAAYKLARAGLAQQQSDARWNRRTQMAAEGARPFNIVGYLNQAAATGSRMPLNNKIVQNIKPFNLDIPEDPYDKQIRSYLNDDPDAFARGGRMTLDRPGAFVTEDGEILFTAAEVGPEAMTHGAGGMKIKPLTGNQSVSDTRQDQIVANVRRSMNRGRWPMARPPVDQGAYRMRPKAAAAGMNFSKLADGFKKKPTPAGPGAQVQSDRKDSAGRTVPASTRAADEGKYYGFDTPEEAMAFRDQTANASNAERAVLNKWGTESGLTTDRRNQGDANNLTIIQRPDGTFQVTKNQDAAQRGSTVYFQDGTSRPATQADIDAANAQAKASMAAGMGFGSSDPNRTKENSPNAQSFLDAWYTDGGIAVNGYNEDGSMRNRDDQRAGAPRFDRAGQRVGTGGQTSGSAFDRAQTQTGDKYAMKRSTPNTGASVPKGEQTTPVTGGGNDAQQSAAKLFAGEIKHLASIDPQFVAALEAGNVPGLQSITNLAAVWGDMTEIERETFVGLLVSTGAIRDRSDIEEAIAKNMHGGFPLG